MSNQSEFNWQDRFEPTDQSGKEVGWCIRLPIEKLLYATKTHPNNYFECFLDGRYSYGYAHGIGLIPKKKFHPWTAKQWGARIDDEFIYDGHRVKLVAVATTTLCFQGESEHYPIPGPQYAADQNSEKITQLDGSPCGDMR